MSIFRLLIFILLPISVHAQLHIHVLNIPANGPALPDIYIAGNFNNWQAGDTAYKLQNSMGIWSITLNTSVNPVQFKFTRGTWPTVEGNASGGFLPNRTHNWQAGDTLKLNILSWEDIGGSNSTAAANVQVLSNSFAMPPLNRTRKIWIYLPPNYTQSTDSFAVLYMHDGQNLFDNATAFSGEWQVDETLNALHAQGKNVPIVVGINNGGADRLHEYSPWVNAQYGGGQGDLYIDFLVDYLKPYIDSAYRTRKTADYTGIMGSSMGGLISFYGGLREQNTFGKIGIFSPSYWFSSSSYAYPNQVGINNNQLKVYQLAGGLEGNGSVVVAIERMRDSLMSSGLPTAQILNKTVASGTHSESFWRQEFGEAYLWLFDQNLQVMESSKAEVKIYPNPSSDSLILEGVKNHTCYKIVNTTGQCVQSGILESNVISIQSLAAGMYVILLEGNASPLGRFIKK